MPNYPQSTGPTDPSAPWNQEGWSPTQEKLAQELYEKHQERSKLYANLEALEDVITELRIEIWDADLDPDEVLGIMEDK